MGWHSGKFVYKCDLRIIADFNYLLIICVAIAGLSALAIIVLYVQIYRAILKQVNKSTRQPLEILFPVAEKIIDRHRLVEFYEWGFLHSWCDLLGTCETELLATQRDK